MDLRDFVDRYGLPLGVLAVFALVLALVPGNASNQSVDAGGAGNGSQLTAGGLGAAAGGGAGRGGEGSGLVNGGATGGGATGGAGTGGATATNGGAGGSGGAATGGEQAGGSAWSFVNEGAHCRPDSRQAGIALYMAPCVAWAGGDNGGETFRGVKRDKIVVVRYLTQIDPGTRAILESARLSDSPSVVKRAYDAIRVYSNQHYETYGREIEFVDFNASGPSDDDPSSKADALKIANDIKPFAVIEGDPAGAMPPTLYRELAQRNILCMCSTSQTSALYTELPPMLFSALPTVDEYAEHVGAFLGRRLNGQPAKWAGDELNPAQGFTTSPRRFGLIYLQGIQKADPESERAKDIMVATLQRHGVKLSHVVGYVYEGGRNQRDVTNLVAQLKDKKISTVIGLWDPLYPILITGEATRQQYYPEWFISGFGLSDTTAAGRLYDQLQWRHAFGVSPLWVTWADVARSPGYREYHHGRPGGSPGDEGVLINIYRSRIQTLFRGIHMAGPTLNNDTFVAGQFAFPPTGGSPTAPLYYLTRELPTEIKDFTEIWYDADRSGPDERSEDGTGMIAKVDGGRRYLADQWPAGEPKAFVEDGSEVTVTNEVADPPHEEDGHRHDPAQRCLSCR